MLMSIMQITPSKWKSHRAIPIVVSRQLFILMICGSKVFESDANQIFNISQMRINDSFCGLVGMQDPINTLIDGGIAMSATTVIKYGTLITAIAVSRIEEHTIAFLGTSEGKLKKVCVHRYNLPLQGYPFPITYLHYLQI